MDQPQRKIIHVDMDAFYASIEQRDHPRFRGRPVVVGGDPDSRGVVAAASYEARKFGIRSAIPCARAAKLCPDAIFVRPRFEVYRQVSRDIREIFFNYTDLVEPLSLDEAYLDVTDNKVGNPSATLVAREIRDRILDQTGLTASAGIAPNKFLAKIASDLNKPNGQAVIPPERVDDFLRELPVGRISGVGPVTERKMEAIGVLTGGDLREKSIDELTARFGKQGQFFFNLARGIDNRPVSPNRIRKSVSAEQTFGNDYKDLNWLRGHLSQIAERVSERLLKSETSGRTITLKVKYDDFEQVTRSRTVDGPTNDPDTILRTANDLLKQTEAGTRKVRLLGIGVSNLDNDPDTGTVPAEAAGQMTLW